MSSLLLFTISSFFEKKGVLIDVSLHRALESMKAGRRLPEARFANLHLAHDKQKSVLEHFG